mgnify:FL=1
MKSIFKILLITLLISLNPSSVMAEIKLYLDESRTKHIMVEEQDCSIYQSKDGKITLGFKASGLLFGIGPEISFGNDTGINWGELSQRLVARYLELCTRFNTGSITKSEYDKRLEKIEAIETKAYKLYQQVIEETRKRRDKIFEELDEMTDKNSSKKKSYKDLKKMIQPSKTP